VPIRGLVGLVGVVLIALLLWDIFETVILPRRVTRRFKLTALFYQVSGIPWSALAKRWRSGRRREGLLSFYGPLSLIMLLILWVIGLIVGYALIQWALGSPFRMSGGKAGFGTDLYVSGPTFLTLGWGDVVPPTPWVRAITVAEVGTGFGVLAIVIGYLPVLYGAFSQREVNVSLLDARAGSPPSAGALLERSALRGGWSELDVYLREWESWTAELMETHLSYPILGYFRSQHVNQNWLAGLTTVVDACAYAIAYGPDEAIEAAELTFRIGRHALADLAHAFTTARSTRRRPPPERERLTSEALAELHRRLEGSGLQSASEDEESKQRLEKLRSSYEPYATTISRQLALELPDWIPAEVHDNWRLAVDHRRRDLLLP